MLSKMNMVIFNFQITCKKNNKNILFIWHLVDCLLSKSFKLCKLCNAMRNEPLLGKTNNLHMRKLRCRSASQ